MTDFKLLKIKLFNFACYAGEVEIDFTTKENKNIFLFNVRNGSGKTSLFHAIKWGFYGEAIEYYKDSTKIQVKDFLNDRLDPTTDLCYVDITFEYDNAIFILTRKYQPNISSISTVILQKDGRAIPNPESIQEHLDTIIPKNFADFFMFDGEQLSGFMTAQRELNYRDSVHQLLGLKQLRILRDDLKRLQERYETNLTKQKSTNDEVNAKKDMIAQIKGEIDNLSIKINRSTDEITKNEEIKDQLADKRAQYANLPKVMEQLRTVNDKRDELNEQITRIKTKLEDKSENLFITFIKSDLQRLRDSNGERLEELEDLCGLTDDEAGAQETREVILQKSMPRCDVCGHTLSDKEVQSLKVEQTRLKESIAIFEKNKLERDKLKNESILFTSFIEKLEGFDFQSALDDLKDKENALVELDRKKKELDQESQRDEFGDLAGINKRISQLENRNTAKLMEIKLNTGKIKAYEGKKDEITREIRRLGHDDEIISRTSELSTYASKLVNQIDEVLATITATKRKKILDESNNLFLKITNKPDEYKKLDFESENSYSFVILTQDDNVVTNPSKGEKQILAMSFLLGLNQCTGRNNVILMDTPVASLDDVHSAGIGDALAQLTNQVIFLAQPQELTGEIYTNMKPSIAKEFKVVRDDYKSSIQEAKNE